MIRRDWNVTPAEPAAGEWSNQVSTEKTDVVAAEQARPLGPPSPLERILLVCGATGPPLFVIVFLITGARRPDFSPLRHPVSSLAFGESGWTQRANFAVTGGLVRAFAVGLRRSLRRRYDAGVWMPLIIGLCGVGLIGAGAFVADPLNGYPSGTPLPADRTTHGALHDLFGVPVFLHH